MNASATNDPLDIASLIDSSLIVLDADFGTTPTKVITRLVSLVDDADRIDDRETITEATLSREASSATGLPGGAAIPHCRSHAWKKPTLAFVRLAEPAEFGGADGPSDLIFFIGVPDQQGSQHTAILSALARGLLKKSFTAGLRGAETTDEALEIITSHLASVQRSSPHNGALERKPQGANSARPVNIVAITACPTGIAHTYLAKDALENVAKARDDISLKIETQGSAGTRAVPDEDCQRAEVLICAADIGVSGLSRFGTIPRLDVPISKAVNDPKAVLDQAVKLALQARKSPSDQKDNSASSPYIQRDHGLAKHTSTPRGGELNIRQAVMTGVSFMVPFVAASGLLMALGFLLGGHHIAAVADFVLEKWQVWNLPSSVAHGIDEYHGENGSSPLLIYLASLCFAIGQHGMQAIVAILSAFIAFGLSGRPGIAPGFIGGAISVAVGAGFLGGLISGILAGLIVVGLLKIPAPRWLAALMPMVVIPLIGSLGVGAIMYVVLGAPLAHLFSALQNWLATLDTGSTLVLGAVLGAMMCIDMGGPVNKAAYLFATAGLSSDNTASMNIMAAVMAAGMVPPLATSLATAILPGRFTLAERQNAKTGWLLGASFISEGAIPFAANDPLRIIPPIVAGGAVTGAISMVTGAATRVPHGGVFVLFAVSNPITWLLSIIAGALLAGAAIVMLKRFAAKPATQKVEN